MKKICALIFILNLFFGFSSFAQTPGVKWQQASYGQDVYYDVKPTFDGGYIMAGASDTMGLNYTKEQALTKEAGFYSLVQKTDNAGNVIWKKIFRSLRAFNSILQLSDEGYMSCGNSADFYTQCSFVRFDKDGNIIWQKSYGGDDYDYGQSIIQTQDGGYVMAGYSNSALSGNHGSYDFWIMRLNSSGDLVWQKLFGGSADDKAYSVKATSDKGFIVVGKTTSNDGDVTVNKGGEDAWLVKIDSAGNKVWQKSFGGTQNDAFRDVVQTTDAGYLLNGYTYSNDGDVSGNHGNADYWVAKINASGSLVSQKCFGGSGIDWGLGLNSTVDKAFLLTGYTESTNGNVKFNNGGADVWNLKIDSSVNMLWEKPVGSANEEYGYAINGINEGNYVGCGFTNYPHGLLYQLGSTNTITGTVFIDKNSNGVKDVSEPLSDQALITTKKSGITMSAIPHNGMYSYDVDTGSFTTKVSLYNSYYTAVPSSKNSSFNNYFNIDTINFALQPIPNKQDLQINVVPLSASVPGFNVSYKILYQNAGTEDIANGYIQFVKDKRLDVVSSIPSYSSINGDTLKWNYSNLRQLDTASILLNFNVPSSNLNIGDTLASIATINPVVNDLTSSDNTISLTQIVQSSFDPNDKTESHSGAITEEKVVAGDYLTYTIRFQNTGTYTAFNIALRDTLSDKLDLNTIQMVSASHDYQLNIKDGNKCVWYFNNILLPDSNTNEHASHGYITYRIKPKSNITVGDIVNNTASIFFDYNLPVETNTAQTIIQERLLPVMLLQFSAKNTGNVNEIKWSTSQEINSGYFEIQRSNDGRVFESLGRINAKGSTANKTDYRFVDDKPRTGINYYRLKMVDKDGKYKFSDIKSVSNSAIFSARINPNPVSDILNLIISSDKERQVQITITNISGEKILSQQYSILAGESTKTINVSQLSAGIYLLNIKTSDRQLGLKFIK